MRGYVTRSLIGGSRFNAMSDGPDPTQRPDANGSPGWVLAAVGCTAGLVAVLVSPVHARSAAAQDWSPFVLVAGLLLVGLVADEDRLFSAAGNELARLAPNGMVLYIGSVVLIVTVTTVLNLDTSVAFLDSHPRLHGPWPR